MSQELPNAGAFPPSPPRPEAQHRWSLSLFEPQYAPLIASWVRSEQELTWLAPGTAPPLTPEKMVAWSKASDRRFMLWPEGLLQPISYGELNNMPDRTDQVWIGHFLVDPAHRGRRHGTRFVQALLGCAFQRLGAREVLLVVFPDNVGAIRCYQRVGMTPAGYERKRFEATGREHVFLRMTINASAYRDLVAAGQMPGDLPLIRRSPSTPAAIGARAVRP